MPGTMPRLCAYLLRKLGAQARTTPPPQREGVPWVAALEDDQYNERHLDPSLFIIPGAARRHQGLPTIFCSVRSIRLPLKGAAQGAVAVLAGLLLRAAQAHRLSGVVKDQFAKRHTANTAKVECDSTSTLNYWRADPTVTSRRAGSTGSGWRAERAAPQSSRQNFVFKYRPSGTRI